jgi:ring-1,2-phenylacetyl-CoA epoxidase subunit PaaC
MRQADGLITLLADWLLGQADDQMVLAHRNSEWTGHAPILEEDIAFANIALDEMGHAQLFYQLLAGLLNEDRERYPDSLVFQRQAPAFRNVQLVELPKGDWAFTIMRQFLFDAWESILLPALTNSSFKELAQAAAAMVNEEKYHFHHSQVWLLRLGLGTEESSRRMQRALDTLWQPAQQLFHLPEAQGELVQENWLPSYSRLQEQWLSLIEPFFEQAKLTIPDLKEIPVAPRSQHSEQLMDLLGEMQMVARVFPGEEW